MSILRVSFVLVFILIIFSLEPFVPISHYVFLTLFRKRSSDLWLHAFTFERIFYLVVFRSAAHALQLLSVNGSTEKGTGLFSAGEAIVRTTFISHIFLSSHAKYV